MLNRIPKSLLLTLISLSVISAGKYKSQINAICFESKRETTRCCQCKIILLPEMITRTDFERKLFNFTTLILRCGSECCLELLVIVGSIQALFPAALNLNKKFIFENLRELYAPAIQCQSLPRPHVRT